MVSANLFALLCVMFSCVYVNFPSGVLGRVWYLIVTIPDTSLLPDFHRLCIINQVFLSINSFLIGNFDKCELAVL